jgi:hypothetical protein
MGDGSPQGGYSEAISQLQNIARQLSAWSQSQLNAYPVPTSTTSPTFTGVTLNTTTAALIVAASTLRHGMILSNPGTTAAYIWPTETTTSLASTSLGGSMLVAAGSSVILSSSQFPNNTAGWSGISTTAAGQFSVWQFF